MGIVLGMGKGREPGQAIPATDDGIPGTTHLQEPEDRHPVLPQQRMVESPLAGGAVGTIEQQQGRLAPGPEVMGPVDGIVAGERSQEIDIRRRATQVSGCLQPRQPQPPWRPQARQQGLEHGRAMGGENQRRAHGGHTAATLLPSEVETPTVPP